QSVKDRPSLALRPAVRVNDDGRQSRALRRWAIKPGGDHPAVKGRVANQLRLTELRKGDARAARMRQLAQGRSTLASQGCQVPGPHIHVVARPVENQSEVVVILREFDRGQDT